jgi:hypothetical protein
MPRAEDTSWEFRLSTDGTLFAFYDPGNGPWFVPKTPLEEWKPDPRLKGWNNPQPWMKGRFVESSRIDGFGFEWIRFLPAPVAAREVLKVVAEWADGEPSDSEAVARLAFQLGRKGYRIPAPGEEDDE